uniref:Uncharacterized protein n=1 Tax=Oryza meridionalis TaxID=40149 RepID=A0A0E0C5T5_9ORYZ
MPRALVLSLPRSAAAGGITALMSGAGSGDWGGCCPCKGEKRGMKELPSPLFCHGSKVSVGESKLCHTVLLLESLITRLPVSRRVTVVCLPEDVLLSHTVVPLVSARTRLPSWPSDTLEP